MTLRLALIGLAAFAALAPATPVLAAQDDLAQRLRDRVPAEVVSAVERLAAGARAKGLPVEPLVQKAIEGAAKGVPAPRVVAALEVLADRLETALVALRSGGAEPEPAAVEAGAFALGTGLGAPDLGRLARASRPPHTPEVTLRVAGALAALGVPADQSVALVEEMVVFGRAVADVVNLPAQVQAGISRGLTPAQAASGAARGVGRGRQGPPPQPPGRPPTGRRPPPRGKPV